MSKVIIIDDEPSVTVMLENVLNRYDVDYLIFNSSEVFLDSLDDIFNDAFLFVIDLMMQPVSGPELIEIIRDKGIKTPIYVITGYLEDKLELVNNEIDKFYTKPFDIFKFVNDVKELKNKSNDH